MSRIPASYWGDILYDYVRNRGNVSPRTTVEFINLVSKDTVHLELEAALGRLGSKDS